MLDWRILNCELFPIRFSVEHEAQLKFPTLKVGAPTSPELVIQDGSTENSSKSVNFKSVLSLLCVCDSLNNPNTEQWPGSIHWSVLWGQISQYCAVCYWYLNGSKNQNNSFIFVSFGCEVSEALVWYQLQHKLLQLIKVQEGVCGSQQRCRDEKKTVKPQILPHPPRTQVQPQHHGNDLKTVNYIMDKN